MKKIIKISFLAILIGTSLDAYSIEKEGNWWYIYNGNDIVGSYTNIDTWDGRYSVCCDSPELSQYDKKYRDSSNYYLVKHYETKRKAQNVILKYCKKRY